MIVFIISGLWHGSTFNFFIWGFLHGVFRIIEDVVENRYPIINTNNIMLNVFRTIFNFLIVSFLWLPFRFQNMNEILDIFSRLFIDSALDFEVIGLTINENYWLIIVIVIVIVTDILRKHWDMLYIFNKVLLPFRWTLYALLIVTFLIFGIYGGSFEATDFIYRFF